MDGQRTTQDIWELATTRLGDDAPTQEEMIRLLGQLYAADALQCDAPPDTAELLRRSQKQERRQWLSRFMNPFALRFPLLDPERLLNKGLPLVRPIFGWVGMLLWLLVVVPAIVAIWVHWTDLTENFLDRVLEPQNLLIIWLLFPIIKAIHEFGHAFVTKAYGGEVHEMGIMLLVFTPIPYVDASSASAFRSKWRRMAVGAAGMMVEFVLAAGALFVWLSVEPGLVRTLAYNAVLIASISTVGFNANPLLRFDGYYILADWLEIPNLWKRTNTYLGYLCERYLFGEQDLPSFQATSGERAWFVVYAVGSWIYRILVIAAILLFLMDKFFVLGVLLASFAVVMWFLVPMAKGVNYLLTSPRIRKVRVRAITVTATALAVLVVLVGVLPVPYRTQAEGIVWIPEEAFVRAKTEGFIREVVAMPGTVVQPGDLLIVAEDPVLEAEVHRLEFQLRELQARYAQQLLKDLVKAQMVQEDLAYLKESLAEARDKAADLVIRSRTTGTFVAPRALDFPGRFSKKGELLAHTVNLEKLTVRAVVSPEDLDLIAQHTVRVDVRLAERLAEVTPAVITRVVPAAEDKMPSPALTSEGGGTVPLDPTDPERQKAIKRMFQVDLQLPAPAEFVNAGGRVYVRFDHGVAPLATQWYRALRQLFLSRFNV
jgi:putative peptide zinc metalloprotease protein